MARFHETLRALLDPVQSRRINALQQLQHEGEKGELTHFCGQAAELQLSTALELCNTLGHTTTPVLIDLLGHYATRGEPMLSERAIAALRHVSPDLRIKCCCKLLHTESATVRREACKLLGASTSQAPRNALVGVLGDSNSEVIVAALESLRVLGCSDAAEPVEKCLDHRQVTVVCQAIRTIMDLTPQADFPRKHLCRLLKGDSDKEVKLACCWALGKRPGKEARETLLEVIAGSEPDAVRAGAAAALAPYHETEVMRKLLIAGANSSVPALSLTCRRALSAMPQEELLNVSAEIMAEADSQVRLMVIGLVGELDLPGTDKLLCERLEVEKDLLERATLVEALGRGGYVDSWEVIRPCVEEDTLVAYAAVNALADLLSAEKVADFGRLLKDLEETPLQEAVLKRLVLYGKSHDLPADMIPLLCPYLDSADANLRVLSAHALGCTEDPLLCRRLLIELSAGEVDSLFGDALCTSVSKLCGCSMSRLLRLVGVDQLGGLTAVLNHQEKLGQEPEDFILDLAAACRDKVAGAEDCLQAAASLELSALAATIPKADPAIQAILIPVWSQASVESSSGARIDLESLLHSDYQAVRAAALSATGESPPQPLLKMMVELAQLDPSSEIRSIARAQVRRVVEAAGD